MLITTGGVLIRTRVSEIRELGRSTQGVRLINLGDNEALAGIEKLVEPEDANGVINGNGASATEGNGGAEADDSGSNDEPQ
jgi:DNA gyrase subunit A